MGVTKRIPPPFPPFPIACHGTTNAVQPPFPPIAVGRTSFAFPFFSLFPDRLGTRRQPFPPFPVGGMALGCPFPPFAGAAPSNSASPECSGQGDLRHPLLENGLADMAHSPIHHHWATWPK